MTADIDDFDTNGTELLAVPTNGDANGLRWVGTSTLDYVHTSGDRLAWR